MSVKIKDAKRLVKRIILTNVHNEKRGMAITPLISGRHGIGKSQMMKQIADEFGGTCEVIEGGTLKEGEITGLPYQYKDDKGEIKFQFLPYYVVKRIQDIEHTLEDFSKLSGAERLEAIKSGKVKLMILFFDEINRTETAVYRELMNILLTRSVNGYEFPWWVQIVGAMNPGSQNSEYAVNEMDPAQLDRFLKIKVDVSSNEWLDYAEKSKLSSDIQKFIKDNPKFLSYKDDGLDDKDEATPSPRGWEMASLLLTTEPALRGFFDAKENNEKIVKRDMVELFKAKLGSKAAAAFFADISSVTMTISPEDVFADNEILSNTRPKIRNLSDDKISQTCSLMISYLNENPDILSHKANSNKLNVFIKSLDVANSISFVKSLKDSFEDIDMLSDVIDDGIFKLLNMDNRLNNSLSGITI